MVDNKIIYVYSIYVYVFYIQITYLELIVIIQWETSRENSEVFLKILKKDSNTQERLKYSSCE